MARYPQLEIPVEAELERYKVSIAIRLHNFSNNFGLTMQQSNIFLISILLSLVGLCRSFASDG